MTPDHGNDPKDALAEELAKLSQRLAAGECSEDDPEPELPPDELEAYRLASASIRQLEAIWPRGEYPPLTQVGGEVDNSAAYLRDRSQLGKYRLMRQLGHGSSGDIFLAHDTATGREVVLKIPQVVVLAEPELRYRFVEECRLTLKLDHPNLAKALEADEFGFVCYLALEYTGETSLADRLADGGKLEARAAAAVTAAVARGVQYLHERQILHRDITPGNVLLTPVSPGPLADVDLAQVGIPRLTDLGLAKVMEEVAWKEGDVPPSEGGRLVGTPQYASPEQIDSSFGPVDRHADVYGLGALLYELLTGHPPFQGDSVLDTLLLAKQGYPVPPRKHHKSVPRTLNQICMKCLEQRQTDRYDTAQEVADDLKRFLTGSKIQGRRKAWPRRVGSWVRRHPLRTAVALFLFLAALTVPVLHLVNKERTEQDRQRHLAQLHSERARGVELCEKHDTARGVLWLANALVNAPKEATDLQELLRFDLDAWRNHMPVLTQVLNHEHGIRSIAFSPDSRTLLGICGERSVGLWDTTTGQLRLAPLEHPVNVLNACFSPDGTTIQTITHDGVLWNWSGETGTQLDRRWSQTAQALVPRGRRPRGVELQAEFALGKPLSANILSHQVSSDVIVSPDRCRLHSWNKEGQVLITDLRLEPVQPWTVPHPWGVQKTAFSPDGLRLYTVGKDGYTRVWDLNSRQELLPAFECDHSVHAVAVDPRERYLAAKGTSGLCVWDIATRKLVFKIADQPACQQLVFGPDCQQLAAVENGTVRIWKLPATLPAPLVHPLADPTVAACPDGRTRVFLHINGIETVQYTPNGSRILSGGMDTAVREWDPATGHCVRVFADHTDFVARLSLHPNGNWFLTGGHDGTVRLWELQTGKAIGPAMNHPHAVGGIAIVPTGKHAYVSCLGKFNISWWNLESGQLEGHLALIGGFDLALTPDGQGLLTGKMPDAYWTDLRTGDSHHLPQGGNVFAVAVHPLGNLFVTGTGEGKLFWWDGSNRKLLETTSDAHGDRIRQAAFSPNGDLLATVGWDGKVAFWHSSTRRRVGPAFFPGGTPQSMAFHPLGRQAVVGCKNGRMEFTAVPRAAVGTPRQIQLAVQLATGMELDCHGTAVPLSNAVWQERSQELRTLGGDPW